MSDQIIHSIDIISGRRPPSHDTRLAHAYYLASDFEMVVNLEKPIINARIATVT